MKDCKNRHGDQRHMWNWREEKEFISTWRKWVCLKAQWRPQNFSSSVFSGESGAQNHLRSPTLLLRGPPCPRQALSMFKSFVSGERGRRGFCHLKVKTGERSSRVRGWGGGVQSEANGNLLEEPPSIFFTFLVRTKS